MENQSFYRETWAEIDLDAITKNILSFKKHVPDHVSIMAVVKADGYGHGAVETARTALRAGAKYLAVAILDEALSLRESGIDAPILVLGYVPAAYADLASEHNITLTAFQSEWIDQVSDVLDGKSLRVHLKVDTGMGRLGIKGEEEAKHIGECLKRNPSIIPEGLYTHFATADEPENPFIETQLKRFERFVTILKEFGIDPSWIHLGNSAGSMRIPDRIGNLVRVGISMYGLIPSPDMEEGKPFELNRAFSLHSRLVHVKQMNEGDPISYGSTYTTSAGEWIGTVPVGYADGWIRKLNKMSVLVNGIKAPIVGRICMDQFMVSLPHELPIGTQVTLIGSQGSQEITIDDIAEQLETINYEIPCIISHRVPRVFIENGEKKGVMNTILKK
ncbi:alanine racemase [Alkalihalobacillus sp. CinArs1]|uniref:alanine racemase n=1 Tax=Alkalihalobacillus sp. CinArs1 TaxID=2995314 RepID=UPI0022DE6D5E|nr:alanine racemase [Alkalihalobacillus sp. CinArs1]